MQDYLRMANKPVKNMLSAERRINKSAGTAHILPGLITVFNLLLGCLKPVYFLFYAVFLLLKNKLT